MSQLTPAPDTFSYMNLSKADLAAHIERMWSRLAGGRPFPAALKNQLPVTVRCKCNAPHVPEVATKGGPRVEMFGVDPSFVYDQESLLNEHSVVWGIRGTSVVLQLGFPRLWQFIHEVDNASVPPPPQYYQITLWSPVRGCRLLTFSSDPYSPAGKQIRATASLPPARQVGEQPAFRLPRDTQGIANRLPGLSQAQVRGG